MPAHLLRLALTICLFLSMTSGALADKRVALVIGNSGYQKTGQLPNPAHDAGAIGALIDGRSACDPRTTPGARLLQSDTISNPGNERR